MAQAIQKNTKSNVVAWNGIELDVSNRAAVTAFIADSFLGEKLARMRMHFAAAYAVYHAQQHGDPCYVNDFSNHMLSLGSSKAAKARQTAMDKWFKAIATVTTKFEADGENPEFTTSFRWLDGKPGAYVVKSKSESRRKDTKTLEEILDGGTMYTVLEEAAHKGFSLPAFLNRFAKLDESFVKKMTEEGEQVPSDLLNALRTVSGIATRYKIAAELAEADLKTAPTPANDELESSSDETGSVAA